MTLYTVEGNLLGIKTGVICHQVNCQGVMGSGIALQIKTRWPDVFETYSNHVRRAQPQAFRTYVRPGRSVLGELDLVRVEDGLYVANIYGQDGYGQDGRRYTNYGAVARSFAKLSTMLSGVEEVYVPYNMGCDRGGGDWTIYSEIIEAFIPTAVAVKLP